MLNNGGSPTLKYVTFSGNAATLGGGAMYNMSFSDGTPSSPIISQ